MADEYTPDAAADDALCTAADDRAIQYAVPGATDDDLALADSVFVNRVHQAILGSTWLEERLEQARAEARGAALAEVHDLIDGARCSYGDPALRLAWGRRRRALRDEVTEHGWRGETRG